MKFLNALDKRRWSIMGLESDQLTGSSRIRPHFNWNFKAWWWWLVVDFGVGSGGGYGGLGEGERHNSLCKQGSKEKIIKKKTNRNG